MTCDSLISHVTSYKLCQVGNFHTNLALFGDCLHEKAGPHIVNIWYQDRGILWFVI